MYHEYIYRVHCTLHGGLARADHGFTDSRCDGSRSNGGLGLETVLLFVLAPIKQPESAVNLIAEPYTPGLSIQLRANQLADIVPKLPVTQTRPDQAMRCDTPNKHSGLVR